MLGCIGVVVDDLVIVESLVLVVFFLRIEVGVGKEECCLLVILLFMFEDFVLVVFGIGV